MKTESNFNRKLHEMLMRAMDLDEVDRIEFIHNECSDDRALLNRLLELLETVDNPDLDLDQPVLVEQTQRWDQIPDAVGNYLVVGVLGVGGMATVYEAIQEDPKRTVALKVMNQGIANSDAYIRFRFETEMLARLHHPGIAQIYEAGAAQLGQESPAPFFAMELVANAVPITIYVKNHDLPLRSRLEMFTSVCDAVHHGHQHGVIHRDLKPANVLIDGEGRSKVIDFGVARTTGGGAESITALLDVSQLIGTLNYMSPEQCQPGADIDTRTDVYSLGVILYELVCGHLPHDLVNLPIPTALHTIMHEPPHRFAIQDAPVPKDLEAIIFKSIEKEPDRRYGSASTLSSDLRRYLNNQTVEARQPSVANYCRLFIRRHRALVAASATIIASILLITIVSLWFAIRLNNEVSRRRVAESQAIRERDVAQWEAYIAQISGALSAMKNDEFEQMRAKLSASAYQPRDWEWGFLSRLAEKSVSTTIGHGGMIMDLAVNQSWTRYATATNNGVINLWDALTHELIATWEDQPESMISSICFTADEQFIVCGDGSGVIRLFSSNDLHLVDTITEKQSSILSVDDLYDGNLAIVRSDGSASIITIDPRESVPFPEDQPGKLQGITVSPDRSLIASFNREGSIWIRNTEDLAVKLKVQFPGNINQIRLSTDGKMVAAVGASNRVYIWDTTDGALLHELEATDGVNTVRSLAFSHDGNQLAVGLTHRGVVVFSINEGKIIGELGGHTDAVSGLQFSPDNQVLLSTSWDRTTRTWRASEFTSPGGVVTLEGHRGYVRSVAFSPVGSMVASVSHDGTLRLWDPDLTQLIAVVEFANDVLYSVAFSSDNRLIAIGSSNRTIKILNAFTTQVVAELGGYRGGIVSVGFDPTGTRLVAGGSDGSVYVWDLPTQQMICTLQGHNARVNSVCFNPDGSLIASGSRDHTVRIWDVNTQTEQFHMLDHESDVFAVLFSPDGSHLYSGSRDQTVRVWDTKTGSLVSTLSGHGQYATCLSINPQGTRLAVGSWFGEIILFDIKKHDLIASFRAHDSAIRGIAFSPDGRWLASASYDSTVHLYDSATRQESDTARVTARSSLDTAQHQIKSVLNGINETPDFALSELLSAGVDPAKDSWIQKALLSELAPAQADESSTPDQVP